MRVALSLVWILACTIGTFSSHAEGKSTSLGFYSWDEVQGVLRTEGDSASNASTSSTVKKGVAYASQMIGGVPVYISMTTIHNRLYGVAATLETILKGSVLPTHIYIFVSSEPYLLDQGISKDFFISSSHRLRALSEWFPHISVVFTDNIGPHRKLLPLLAKKWEEDCVIVTVDDHEMYPPGMLASLVSYYRASGGSAVVALRSRRMGICANSPPWRVSPYTKKHKGLWPETKPGRREMLMLPTGTGGVLYRPQFFHPIVFDRRFLNLTRTGDDLMFRLATMAKGVAVVTACTEHDGRTCPTPKYFGSVISSQEIPHLPLLKSIKRIDFEDYGGANHSMSRPPSLGAAGVGTKGVASADGKNGAVRVWKEPEMADELEKKDEEEEELAAATARAKVETARTLQQRKIKAAMIAHENHLAVLNEVGSLRGRRRLESEGGDGVADTSTMEASPLHHHSRHGHSRLESGISSAGGQREKITRGDESSFESQEGAVESKHKDMRKKESLASKFNSLGGNNVMWTHSITFLNHMGVLDFESVLQYYAPKERKPCVLFSSVFSKGAGSSKRDIFSSTLDNFRIYLQNIYNHECGVLLCREQDEG